METPEFPYLSPLGSISGDPPNINFMQRLDIENYSPLFLSLSATPTSMIEETSGDFSSFERQSLYDSKSDDPEIFCSDNQSSEEMLQNNNSACIESNCKKLKFVEKNDENKSTFEERSPLQSQSFFASMRADAREIHVPATLPDITGGRKSPICKLLEQSSNKSYPEQMLLLDYEEIQRQKCVYPKVLQHYTSGSFESLIAKEINTFYESSPVCKSLREYAKETKYSNDYIATNLQKIYENCKRLARSDYFPPTSNQFGNVNTEALYLVSIPTAFLEAPEENPSHSFCDVEVFYAFILRILILCVKF